MQNAICWYTFAKGQLSWLADEKKRARCVFIGPPLASSWTVVEAYLITVLTMSYTDIQAASLVGRLDLVGLAQKGLPSWVWRASRLTYSLTCSILKFLCGHFVKSVVLQSQNLSYYIRRNIEIFLWYNLFTLVTYEYVRTSSTYYIDICFIKWPQFSSARYSYLRRAGSLTAHSLFSLSLINRIGSWPPQLTNWQRSSCMY